MELRVLQEKNEVHVKNLKTEVVSSPAEILELVEKAQGLCNLFGNCMGSFSCDKIILG
jgi:hypothetical protein